tara:strand:+ start:218 stop:646 length:429 start_codon:yes stop_codon:yes gene_type:complete
MSTTNPADAAITNIISDIETNLIDGELSAVFSTIPFTTAPALVLEMATLLSAGAVGIAYVSGDNMAAQAMEYHKQGMAILKKILKDPGILGEVLKAVSQGDRDRARVRGAPKPKNVKAPAFNMQPPVNWGDDISSDDEYYES